MVTGIIQTTGAGSVLLLYMDEHSAFLWMTKTNTEPVNAFFFAINIHKST